VRASGQMSSPDRWCFAEGDGIPATPSDLRRCNEARAPSILIDLADGTRASVVVAVRLSAGLRCGWSAVVRGRLSPGALSARSPSRGDEQTPGHRARVLEGTAEAISGLAGMARSVWAASSFAWVNRVDALRHSQGSLQWQRWGSERKRCGKSHVGNPPGRGRRDPASRGDQEATAIHNRTPLPASPVETASLIEGGSPIRRRARHGPQSIEPGSCPGRHRRAERHTAAC
jgi:hypothetical protein